jgi:hypothetical protein
VRTACSQRWPEPCQPLVDIDGQRRIQRHALSIGQR